MKVDSKVADLEGRLEEHQKADKVDKDDISLAIKDVGEVMESLHVKTTSKLKELSASQKETNNYVEKEFKMISGEFETFSASLENIKTEASYSFVP